MEVAELKGRLAAIVVADVERYSRLMHNLIRGQSLMTDPSIR